MPTTTGTVFNVHSITSALRSKSIMAEVIRPIAAEFIEYLDKASERAGKVPCGSCRTHLYTIRSRDGKQCDLCTPALRGYGS